MGTGSPDPNTFESGCSYSRINGRRLQDVIFDRWEEVGVGTHEGKVSAAEGMWFLPLCRSADGRGVEKGGREEKVLDFGASQPSLRTAVLIW